MESQQAPAYLFTPIDAGVDWLTATAKAGVEGRPFRDACEALRDEERAAGGDMKPATLRDYTGHRGEGFFVGTRRDDSICILSGGRSSARWRSIARAAHNCSRVDLQVSLWTNGEQPELARENYHYLKALPPGRGRPRNLTLIQSHPRGETLNVGRRISDAYGRMYDWSAAHTKGEARTIWRFEVEHKRHYAAATVSALLGAADHRSFTNHYVHSWFAKRNVAPPWEASSYRHSDGLSLTEKTRDVLAWFEDSVSKTVAREINRVGIERVLSALGLSDKVQPIGKEIAHGPTVATRSLPHQSHRRDSRADDQQPVPLSRGRQRQHEHPRKRTKEPV